jgi:thiol-disulfide isomerase/thioredoxin
MKSFFMIGILLLRGMWPGVVFSQAKQELTVGDIMPDIEFNEVVNFGKSKIKISDFKGKALILDLWATWCGSCVSNFPKIDSLQRQFQDDLQILGVTYQDSLTVSKLLNTLARIRNIHLPSVAGDTVVSSLFKYHYIPHYIWINRFGIIQAITGAEELGAENIRLFISNQSMRLPVKIDKVISYDGKKPIYAGKLIEMKDELLYHSVIARYRQELGFGSYSSGNKINCLNHSILKLYQLAFSKFDVSALNNKTVKLEGFETKIDSIRLGFYTMDSESLKIWKNTREENTYTYELVVDSSFSRNQKFEMMQQDLNRFFKSKGIQGWTEKQKTRVWALVRVETEDRLSTKGGRQRSAQTNFSLEFTNSPFSTLVIYLQSFICQDNALPIIDKTGYSKNIDLAIKADLNDFAAVNTELQRYGLKLVETEDEVNMLIIKKIKN